MVRLLRLLLAAVARGLRTLAGRLTPTGAMPIPAPESDAEPAAGPPGHWLAMVRARAPGLHLSLCERGLIDPQRRIPMPPPSDLTSRSLPSAPAAPSRPLRRSPPAATGTASSTMAPQRDPAPLETKAAALNRDRNRTGPDARGDLPATAHHPEREPEVQRDSIATPSAADRMGDATACSTITTPTIGPATGAATIDVESTTPPQGGRDVPSPRDTHPIRHRGRWAPQIDQRVDARSAAAATPEDPTFRHEPSPDRSFRPYPWTPHLVPRDAHLPVASPPSASAAPAPAPDPFLPAAHFRWSTPVAEPEDDGCVFPRLPDESPHRSLPGRAGTTGPMALGSARHRPAPIIEDDGTWPARLARGSMTVPLGDRWPELPTDEVDAIADDPATPEGHRERLADEQRGVTWNG